jgi:hypothetical protein
MANPTFDAEFAISMTVNAKLLKTPHRRSPPAGASELMLDSLDKKTSEEQYRDGQYAPKPQVKWRTRLKVSRRRSAKSAPAQPRRRPPKGNVRQKARESGAIENSAGIRGRGQKPAGAETFELTIP